MGTDSDSHPCDWIPAVHAGMTTFFAIMRIAVVGNGYRRGLISAYFLQRLGLTGLRSAPSSPAQAAGWPAYWLV
jgi:hypothetical protein